MTRTSDASAPVRGHPWLVLAMGCAAVVLMVIAAQLGWDRQDRLAVLLAVFGVVGAWRCAAEAVNVRRDLRSLKPSPLAEELEKSDAARAFRAFRGLSEEAMRPSRYADYSALRQAALTQFALDFPDRAADPAMRVWIECRLPEKCADWKSERSLREVERSLRRHEQIDAWLLPAVWSVLGLGCVALGAFTCLSVLR